MSAVMSQLKKNVICRIIFRSYIICLIKFVRMSPRVGPWLKLISLKLKKKRKVCRIIIIIISVGP